jgi:hypothetical protein
MGRVLTPNQSKEIKMIYYQNANLLILKIGSAIYLMNTETNRFRILNEDDIEHPAVFALAFQMRNQDDKFIRGMILEIIEKTPETQEEEYEYY